MFRVITIVILAILIEIAVLAVAVPQETVIDVINKERMASEKWLGTARTNRMIADSERFYQTHIIDNGIEHGLYAAFHVNSDTEDHVYKNSEEFQFVAHRIDTFWLMVKAAIMRVELLVIFLLLACMIIVPAVIDGSCVWAARRYGEKNVASKVFDQGKYVLEACAAVPFAMVLAPFALNPIYMVAWGLTIALAAWIVSNHLQQGL